MLEILREKFQDFPGFSRRHGNPGERDGQTDPHTDKLVTILCIPPCGKVIKPCKDEDIM